MDNQAAIKLTKANELMCQSKYIDVHHHFIQEHEQNGSKTSKYHPSATLTADILFKPLTQHRFESLKKDLSLQSGPAREAAATG